MQLDFDRLSQYQEEGKLRHGVNRYRDLHVWCYTNATVYNRDWDDLTLLCRGLVTDGTGAVVSRPWPKFFNWGEPLAPGPEVASGPFWSYEKADGTLIVVGLDADGETVINTKGSFDTWHSVAAYDMLAGWKPVPGSTAMFEFIHPDNRIVIDYHGREELVLLGAVSNETGEDHFIPEDYANESGWHGALAVPHALNLQSVLQTVQDPANGPNREGFVLVWPNPTGPSPRVKIKFAGYLAAHGILSNLSNLSVWDALSAGSLDPLLELVPDEFHERVRGCADALEAQHEAHRGLAEAIAGKARGMGKRKEQAEYILANEAIVSPALAFKALDGRGLDEAVWKHIRPAREIWGFMK